VKNVAKPQQSRRKAMFRRRKNKKTTRKLKTRRFSLESLERRELFSVGCLDDPTALDCVGPDSGATPAEVASATSDADDSKLLDVSLEVTDTAGNPITWIAEGHQGVLNVYVNDLRDGGSGAFSAYLDVNYDANLASVAGPLTYSNATPQSA